MKNVPYKTADDKVSMLGGYICWAGVHVGQVVYTGHRHRFILDELLRLGVVTYTQSQELEKGFVCCNGYFINRYISGKIAANCRQLGRGRPMGYELISEDIFKDDGSYIVPKSEWRLQ